MTPEEINRKIADCLGYKWKPKGDKYGPLVHPWIDPKEDRTPFIPNFYNDLNACAEMERTLDETEKEIYAGFLETITEAEIYNPADIVAYPEVFKCANATAPQRCEAFLRTKGLWE